MFTVFGSSGFIGSRVVQNLRDKEIGYINPSRNFRPEKWVGSLGHVIYCIGLTADFRTKPLETMEAHVGYLVDVLRECAFDSFTYLSSTRVYGTVPYLLRESLAQEDGVLAVNPNNFEDVYNISKLAGESACLSSGRDNVKVVRLSNVYGYDAKSENFIFTLIRDALRDKRIVLRSTLESGKDHVGVDDVARILPEIAVRGKQKIYNVASGKNVSVGRIVARLQDLTGCVIEVDEKAQEMYFPRIDIGRLTGEFEFKPKNIVDDLEKLVEEYKRHGKRE